MSAVAIEYLKKHADFETHRLEFWPGLFIYIEYRHYDSHLDKYHWDILAITDYTDRLEIASLAYDLLSKDEVLPYMFNRLEAGPNSARSRLIERLNEILIGRCTEEERVKLPGRCPILKELGQNALNALTGQQYDAYVKAFEMFDSVFWPYETRLIRQPSKRINEPRTPEQTRRDAEAFCQRNQATMKIPMDKMCPWTQESPMK